jgi:hypothetical protein
MAAKLALSGTLGIGLLSAIRLVGWPLLQVNLPASTPLGPTVTRVPQQLPIDSLAAATAVRDPFRFTHRPAAVAYDPLRSAEPTAPPAPKPVLQLAGIVWEGGRDPTALIEGFPGTEGVRVVKVGDLVAGLHVQRIAHDYVRIEGLDTTWVLKVRESWR